MAKDWNEEEDGVGAHMKRERGDHTVLLTLEALTLCWRDRHQGDESKMGEKVEQREEKCSFWRSSKTPDIYLVFLCSAETIQ